MLIQNNHQLFYGFILSILMLLPSSHANSYSSSEDLPPFQPNFVGNGSYDNFEHNAEHICTRECKEGEKPKICYYKFTVEQYVTMGGACESCPLVKEDCFKPQCVTADGKERTMVAVNRQLPSPAIQVCQGDKIVVDVMNKMKSKSISIHWHGVRQLGTQHMDGVPMVTQCPIVEGQTFRYIFNGETAGTFFYHSHSGVQKADGFTGALIIREPKKFDLNGHLYTYDLPSHYIFIMDWMHTTADDRYPGKIRKDVGQKPNSYLINGKGVDTKANNIFSPTLTPMQVYKVKQNCKYVFRSIAALCLSCQVELTIEGHSMVVISTDDRPAAPVTVNKIIVTAGERFDFIIHTNNKVQPYWITVRGLDACANTYQVAILYYEGSNSEMPPTLPFLQRGTIYHLNPKNSLCTDESLRTGICVSQMRSREKTHPDLLKLKPDLRLAIVFGFNFYTVPTLYILDTYHTFFVPAPGVSAGGMVNNKILQMSPSPLLSQYKDVPRELFCTKKCKHVAGKICECLNLIKIPLNSIVEMIFIDGSAASPVFLAHPFHMHGHYYHVMKEGKFGANYTASTAELNENLMNGSFLHDYAAMKDTITIPPQGYTVVRAKFDNAGFWLLHCHFAFHFEAGMGAIIWVGGLSDIPPKPKNFPSCGNFLPSIH